MPYPHFVHLMHAVSLVCSDQPCSDHSCSDQPFLDQSCSYQLRSDQSCSDQPCSNQSCSDHSCSDHSCSDRWCSDQSSPTNHALTNHAATNRASTNPSPTNQAAVRQSALSGLRSKIGSAEVASRRWSRRRIASMLEDGVESTVADFWRGLGIEGAARYRRVADVRGRLTMGHALMPYFSAGRSRRSYRIYEAGVLYRPTKNLRFFFPPRKAFLLLPPTSVHNDHTYSSSKYSPKRLLT